MALLVKLALLLGCGCLGATRIVDVATEWAHFGLVNELRAAGFTCPKGATYAPNPTPLVFDCRLWRASHLHSEDMGEKGYFAHDTPDGVTPHQRAAAQGVQTKGENIAAGSATAQAVLQNWKNSDGHCKNMGNPGFKTFGVGHAHESGTGCGDKNDILCGSFASKAALEGACLADSRCVAYSTRAGKPGAGAPWCMKRKYSAGDKQSGHNCYVKRLGTKPTAAPLTTPGSATTTAAGTPTASPAEPPTSTDPKAEITAAALAPTTSSVATTAAPVAIGIAATAPPTATASAAMATATGSTPTVGSPPGIGNRTTMLQRSPAGTHPVPVATEAPLMHCSMTLTEQQCIALPAFPEPGESAALKCQWSVNPDGEQGCVRPPCLAMSRTQCVLRGTHCVWSYEQTLCGDALDVSVGRSGGGQDNAGAGGTGDASVRSTAATSEGEGVTHPALSTASSRAGAQNQISVAATAPALGTPTAPPIAGVAEGAAVGGGDDSEDSSRAGAIAGAVIGTALLLVLVAGFTVRRHEQQANAKRCAAAEKRRASLRDLIGQSAAPAVEPAPALSGGGGGSRAAPTINPAFATPSAREPPLPLPPARDPPAPTALAKAPGGAPGRATAPPLRVPPPRRAPPPAAGALTHWVLYDYTPAASDEGGLAVRTGDAVHATDAGRSGDGWSEVRLPGGQRGLVPSSYLERCDAAAAPAAAAVPAGQRHIAVYDYSPADADEVELRAGDPVVVLARDAGEGWWRGELANAPGVAGLFPASYVRPASSEREWVVAAGASRADGGSGPQLVRLVVGRDGVGGHTSV